MKRILIYYNFILATVMTLIGFSSAETYMQLAIAAMFYPVALYFGLLIAPRRKRAIQVPEAVVQKKTALHTRKESVDGQEIEDEEVLELQKLSEEEGFDLDRRAFVKLIGSAGLSVFFLSLFTKKAQAAFFGSVPGPGTVAIKDSTGTVIDPAKNHPTDGYRVAEIDDASDPTYYGFTNNDAAWFILQDSSGTYRYAVGSTDFSTNWTGRAGLSYSRYEDVF